jgi:hydrogenase/urease accessory protein HupE
MAASEKTAMLSVVCGIAGLFDGACEVVGGYAVANRKMITAIVLVFGFVQITMAIDPVSVFAVRPSKC